MAKVEARGNAIPDVVTLADVQALAGAGGPCITLAMSIPNPIGEGDRREKCPTLPAKADRGSRNGRHDGRRIARADRTTDAA